MTSNLLRCSLLFLLLVILACGSEPPRGLLIENVHIVDLAPGGLRQHHDVFIEGDSIVLVAPTGTLRVRPATTVDGDGRYLIPGLTDAHVHIDHPDELNLYPAYGVTSLMVMRGLPHHLTWRAEILAGSRFGPRLVTTGDYVDGYPPTMQPMTSVETSDDARRVVTRQTNAGYDFVKVYTRLTGDQLTAITLEASQHDRCVVGHAGRNYPLADLVAAGQANIAHGQDLIRWTFDGVDDPTGVERVVAALANSNTTVTPNLSFTEGLVRQGDDLEALLAAPEARFLHPALLQPVRRANNRYVRNGNEWLEDMRVRLTVEQKLALALHRAGIVLLAGTDASTSGVFPGASLHRELALLVEAGLTPAEALATATVAPGAFLQRCVDPDLQLGRIEKGYRADLVLLTDNPLESIKATTSMVGIVRQGAWNAKEALDQRLQRLDESYADLRPEVEALESELFSGDLEAARVRFERLRSVDPNAILFSQYVPFFVGYSFLYGQDGYNDDPTRLASALGLYELYAETYPWFHSAHYLLGLAREAIGEPDRAAASFRQALTIHPEHPDARRALDRLPKTESEAGNGDP